MKRYRKRQAIALLSVAFLAMLALFYSGNRGFQITGYSGNFKAGIFTVDRITEGSPADGAGLRVGDKVKHLDAIPIQAWQHLFKSELSAYFAQRASWHNRQVPILVDRNGKSLQLNVATRAPGFGEWVEVVGAKLMLILVLISLSAFILISNPKEKTALLFALCFTSAALWIAAEMPYWPKFMSAAVTNYSTLEFAVHNVLVTFSMQIAISSFLHVLVVFPRPIVSKVLRRYLVIGIYILPVSCMLLAIIYYANSNFVDRMTEVYRIRLWMDTSLLCVAIVLILLGYGMKKTRIQIEQSRLIMASVLIFTSLHLALWNIPKLLFGVPLVPSYNWMVFASAIIPISLTLAIANHQIFGVRGLVQRRLQYLQSIVKKERLGLNRRDDRIASLKEEINQLRSELQVYESSDSTDSFEITATDKLQNLEQQYPMISEARKTQLLGVSPLWERVFSGVVLASKGNVPVLIVGESGTGKTAVARLICALAGFSENRYREISCAQFEHADPAFALGRIFGVGSDHGLQNLPKTGSRGLLEECDGGALFLDDFDRLPLNVQDLLLYPLEGKPFEPGIGTGAQKTVSIKFVIATNRDPAELIELGKFQADVVARFGAKVQIPPLRDRPEDIPVLIGTFLGEICDQIGHQITSITPQVMRTLKQFPYSSGNVRELISELRQAIGNASLEADAVLRESHLCLPVSAESKAADPVRVSSFVASAATESGVVPELAVLRKHAFEIKKSEEELGLSHKSKTLSHHLRGMCIQALVDSKGDTRLAAQNLAASSNPKVVAKLHGKIERYARSIEDRKRNGGRERLYVNLPSVYHAALEKALQG